MGFIEGERRKPSTSQGAPPPGPDRAAVPDSEDRVNQNKASAKKFACQVWGELSKRSLGERSRLILESLESDLAGLIKETVPDPGPVIERIQIFRELVQNLENRWLSQVVRGEARAHAALYTYLCSDRSWNDFRSFEALVKEAHLGSFVEQVFALDATNFLDKFQKLWGDTRLVPALDLFVSLAHDSMKLLDVPAIPRLWSAICTGIERGAIKEGGFVRLAGLIVEHGRITASELYQMVQELSKYKVPDTPEIGACFANLGKLLATRPDLRPIAFLDAVSCDPRIEFAYLAASIESVSGESITPQSQQVLVDLYRRAAQHAVSADVRCEPKSGRGQSLETIRRCALLSISDRPQYAPQILVAAMPLLHEPWHTSSGLIFLKLKGLKATAPIKIPCGILKDLVSADSVLEALTMQCEKRQEFRFREDRRALSRVLREIVTMERDSTGSSDNRFIGRLFGLLGSLGEEAHWGVKDALRVLGVRAISLGPFGFWGIPWGCQKDPDPEICSAARRFLRPWERLLSRGIMSKLMAFENVDDGESLVRHLSQGE